jgi:hypothetical protein
MEKDSRATVVAVLAKPKQAAPLALGSFAEHNTKMQRFVSGAVLVSVIVCY